MAQTAGELDHLVKERLHLKGYVRYMDDILVFGKTDSRRWFLLQFKGVIIILEPCLWWLVGLDQPIPINLCCDVLHGLTHQNVP